MIDPEETISLSHPSFLADDKIVIAGCNGRMGNMLLERAQVKGINAAGIDLPYDDAIIPVLSDASLVLVCVPVDHLADTVKKIIPHIAPETILSDITSVKEKPMRQMRELWQGAVVGTHPLFGPMADTGDELPVVIVPDKETGKSQTEYVERFFKALGFSTFESDAVSHDTAMAKIQSMNFITNVAYFAALAGQNDLLPFLTPSFERRKEAARKMLTEDAAMFTALFEANEHCHETVRQFRKFLNLAASGDVDLLCKRAQWWWQKKNGKKKISN